MVNIESYCIGCMELKKDGACPNPSTCAWRDGSTSHSPIQLPPRTILHKKYAIGRSLGQGGFGITYLSLDLESARKTAIKEYFPTSYAVRGRDQHTVTYSSADHRDPYQYSLLKFTQEAETLAKLRTHPNIVSVIESFEGNNTAYIVMEYLDGRTLKKYLLERPNGRISFEECLPLVIPVINALREVHAAGITHRDVSPDNVIIGKSGAVKLIDFGAAKRSLRSDKTQQVILNPGYTPYEQYSSESGQGPTTDVYSLGAVVFRCLTGKAPPEAPSRMPKDTLEPPSKLGIQVPATAEQAILRALAFHAEDRYQNVVDFRRDLTIRPSPLPKIHSRLLWPFRLLWAMGIILTALSSVMPFWDANTLFEAGILSFVLGFLALIFSISRAKNSAVFRDGKVVLVLCLTLAGILLSVLPGLNLLLFAAALWVGNKSLTESAGPTANPGATKENRRAHSL